MKLEKAAYLPPVKLTSRKLIQFSPRPQRKQTVHHQPDSNKDKLKHGYFESHVKFYRFNVPMPLNATGGGGDRQLNLIFYGFVRQALDVTRKRGVNLFSNPVP